MINRAIATADPSEIGPVDAVLFCVKFYDVELAVDAIWPILRPETLVISVLNGSDGLDRIGSLIDPKHVLGGAAYALALIEEPGVVSYKSNMASLVIGAMDGVSDTSALPFRDACTNGGRG